VGVAVAGVATSLLVTGVRPPSGEQEQAPPEVAVAAEGPTAPDPADATPPPLEPAGTLFDVVAFALVPPFALGLVAGDPTWVRVTDDGGGVLFEGTMAAGDMTTVAADSSVQVRVGNPGGLLATADGRLIDHPRPPGQPLTLALG